MANIDFDATWHPAPWSQHRSPDHDRSQAPLGQRLIEAGLIREDQLESALSHQAAETDRSSAAEPTAAGSGRKQCPPSDWAKSSRNWVWSTKATCCRCWANNLASKAFGFAKA